MIDTSHCRQLNGANIFYMIKKLRVAVQFFKTKDHAIWAEDELIQLQHWQWWHMGAPWSQRREETTWPVGVHMHPWHKKKKNYMLTIRYFPCVHPPTWMSVLSSSLSCAAGLDTWLAGLRLLCPASARGGRKQYLRLFYSSLLFFSLYQRRRRGRPII